MKYVYNWYVKMSQDALKKMVTDNKYGPNWVAKVKEGFTPRTSPARMWMCT